MLIISYKMRNTRSSYPQPWTEFCGKFHSWETFTKFAIRENLLHGRQIADPKEVKQPRYTVGKPLATTSTGIRDACVLEDGDSVVAVFPEAINGEKRAKEYAEWLNSREPGE